MGNRHTYPLSTYQSQTRERGPSCTTSIIHNHVVEEGDGKGRDAKGLSIFLTSDGTGGFRRNGCGKCLWFHGVVYLARDFEI